MRSMSERIEEIEVLLESSQVHCNCLTPQGSFGEAA